MCKKNRLIDVNLILLILAIFIQITFFVFNYSKVTMENYICLFLIFITILISYFIPRVYALIFSSFLIFSYCTYTLYESLNYGYYNSLSSYLFIVSVPIISFIASSLSSEIKNLQNINKNFEKKYRELVTIDEITGLNNINAFYSDLNKEISKSLRHKFPLTLMMVKIRYYDNLNSILGENDMKKLILEVSKFINYNTRNEDEGYRIGKDVLGFLLNNTDIKGGEIVKNRVKHEIDTLILTNNVHKNIRIEFKIGIIQYNETKIKNIYDFVKLAEEEIQYDV